ncbi:hypothetical protein C7475_103350 [Chitinophaga sp. S165]|nr:hypothetical protein C7475_103350 [Chitinophaga sp. S165]
MIAGLKRFNVALRGTLHDAKQRLFHHPPKNVPNIRVTTYIYNKKIYNIQNLYKLHPLIPMSMYHVHRSNGQQVLPDASMKKTLSTGIDHSDIVRTLEITEELSVDIRSHNYKRDSIKTGMTVILAGLYPECHFQLRNQNHIIKSLLPKIHL